MTQTLSTMQAWILACRPKTLPAAIAPVVIGSAMAYGDGVEHLPSALLACAGALLIQIATNLANDYFDFVKGTDTADRTGPVRVTQAGLIKPKTVFLAMILVFAAAMVCAAFLIMRAGMPIVVIAILAVLSGVFYTAGPKPLGYLGLGDLFVFVFFGPVAVAGTYYVQSLEMNTAVILAGFAPGLLSTAVLTVNNLRDREGDARAGKKTLPVRFGHTFGQQEFVFCIVVAHIMPVLIYFLTHDHIWSMFAVLSLVYAVPVLQKGLTATDGAEYNRTLAETGLLLLIYSALFSFGWIMI